AGNQPRALMLLEEAGLLEDIDDESAALTLTEEQNPMNLEFEENPPEILAQVVDDSAIDAAIINGNYFLEAGLDVSDAIVVEDADDSPYANILAWNSSNDDNEAVQKLDELLHSDEVVDYIKENWPEGEIIPADTTEQEKYQSLLKITARRPPYSGARRAVAATSSRFYSFSSGALLSSWTPSSIGRNRRPASSAPRIGKIRKTQSCPKASGPP